MEPRIVTVPLHIVKNRPFIDVEWTVTGTQTYTTRCWLDTGGGAVIITEQLAQKLGISYSQSRQKLAPIVLPAMSIGGISFDLTSIQVFVALGQNTIQGEEGVDVFCGAPFLGKYHLIFDYPQHQLVIAEPGAIPLPSGIALPMSVHPQSKFPAIEVQVEGNVYSMLLDTGASVTMISQAVIDHWVSQHPEWLKEMLPLSMINENPRLQHEQAVEIPRLNWGPYQLENIHMITRPVGVFEQFLSQNMSVPVVGALAGNVLSQFRCELDYQANVLYLSSEREMKPI